MSSYLLCILLIAPLIIGFGFFNGGGRDGFFNFNFDDEDDSFGGWNSRKKGAKKTQPKKPLCPNTAMPYLCPVSKLIAMAYNIKESCVARPLDCPCFIPEERKCHLGVDAYICIRKDLPCPYS
jgi:hypothetical protein